MAKPLKPFIRGGGYYPSKRWTPLVYPGGYTTANGGGQPEPEAVLKTVTGSLIHITDALALPAEALTVNVEPVQAGSGDPSPDNVRPISGRTSATVTRTGKNLLDPSLLKDRSAWNTFKITVEPNTWYTCSTNKPQNSLYLYFRNTSGDGGSSTYLVYNSHHVTVKSNENGEVWISQRRVSGTASFADYEIMVEKGSTVSVYEPYQGNTYTFQFGDTVYGGTLDVTNGKMVVDRANIASYNGETLPGEWISDRDVYSTGGTPTIGAQVVYFLATPIEITLTPTQIDMLQGENNLWSDAGDSTLTYYAEGEASTSEALGILLGGTYNNPGGADDVSDDEALGILLGGS